jgi:hypothetical protein
MYENSPPIHDIVGESIRTLKLHQPSFFKGIGKLSSGGAIHAALPITEVDNGRYFLPNIYSNHISRQGRHNLISHRFKEEYLKLLKRFNIEFKEEYLFEWID